MMVFGPGLPAAGDPLGKALSAIFPGPVCGAYASPSEAPGPLLPEESACVSAAVPSRQNEFAQGRWCARRALAELGIAEVAIPVGPHRAPRWPPGVVGSITHCEGFVGVVLTRAGPARGLGFDAEPATPLGADLEPLICTPAELAWITAAAPPSSVGWPKVLFSAKEAIHKCIAPLAGVMLDFREVTVTIRPDRGVFSARLADDALRRPPEVSEVSGRFVVTPEFVFTAALLA
jgi:4'-phosphopantetheinyl transferase EntD